jgi:glycosyltransferase involved in cell wall biosynthesis
VNILLVSNGFPPSGQWGTEFYTYQLATGLAARGHRVTVFCPDRLGEAPRYTLERSTRYQISLVEVHNGGDPKKSFRDSYRNEGIEAIFDRLLEEIRPDVVHFIHMLWGLSVQLPELAKRRGLRTIATLTDYGLMCHRGQRLDASIHPCEEKSPAKCAKCIREPGPWDGGALSRMLKRVAGFGLSHASRVGLNLGLVALESDLVHRESTIQSAMNHVDAWVAPTRALARPFLAAGLDSACLSILPYALDEAPYRAAPKRMEPQGVRFGFLGQFLPHKGLHVLFDAVRILRDELSDSSEPWEVIIYGNKVGGRNGLYMRSIWTDDLEGRVMVEGPFEPLRAPEILAGLDAAILPSLWDENAPLTILQARAAGVPILASDVPGVREVIEEGRGAQLFPPGDPEALAHAMKGVLADRPTREPDRSPPPVTLAAHLDAIESLYGGVATCDYAPRAHPQGEPKSVNQEASLTASATLMPPDSAV